MAGAFYVNDSNCDFYPSITISVNGEETTFFNVFLFREPLPLKFDWANIRFIELNFKDIVIECPQKNGVPDFTPFHAVVDANTYQFKTLITSDADVTWFLGTDPNDPSYHRIGIQVAKK